MKLLAGNPNLMKQAMRVNPTQTLESFSNTTGNKAHKKERTGYVPSVRDPDAVPPNTMSVWERAPYVPERVEPARRGADNHFQYKSRGV